jgi:hypothetical protein
VAVSEDDTDPLRARMSGHLPLLNVFDPAKFLQENTRAQPRPVIWQNCATVENPFPDSPRPQPALFWPTTANQCPMAPQPTTGENDVLRSDVVCLCHSQTRRLFWTIAKYYIPTTHAYTAHAHAPPHTALAGFWVYIVRARVCMCVCASLFFQQPVKTRNIIIVARTARPGGRNRPPHTHTHTPPHCPLSRTHEWLLYVRN